MRAVPGIVAPGTWLPVLRRLPGPPANAVGLSFDDGPTPDTTPALLALLARHGAHATFFLTGERVERHLGLVDAILDGGHTVYAHGYHHLAYAGHPPGLMQSEMSRTEALLSRFRPAPTPYLVRLPYMSGRRSQAMHRAIAAWRPGAQIAFWQFGFDDYAIADGCTTQEELQRHCLQVAARALDHRRLAGSVLLLHEMPYGSVGPFLPSVPLTLTEILLRGLAARGLAASPITPDPAPSAIDRFIQL